MSTLFTQIIERKIPAHIVGEDSQHIAFLDIYPIVRGHTLVVPKQATSYFLNLSDQDLTDLICFAKQVGLALESVLPCKRIALQIIGLEIPHVHIHLLPIQEEKELHGKRMKTAALDGELAPLAQEIAMKTSRFAEEESKEDRK